MVKYIEKCLKLSVKAKMDQNATHLYNYKKLVAKAVRAKAKAGLQPSFYMRKTDQQVFQGSRPAHTTVYKVRT